MKFPKRKIFFLVWEMAFILNKQPWLIKTKTLVESNSLTFDMLYHCPHLGHWGIS